MSIENITEKILAEAGEDSRLVLEAAGNKSRDITKKAEEQAEKIREEFHAKAKEDAALLQSRKTSVAELEVRKMRLGAKQALISRCFDAALNRLAEMRQEEYQGFLVSTILKTGVEGAELLLNPKDRSAIGEKIVQKVNETGKAGMLTLSEDTIAAKGGFVLRKGSMEINSTLEVMVNGIRETAIPDVVKVLFD